MAYPDPNNGNRYRINHFSNPNVKYLNTPTGIRGTSDTASIITNYRFTLANHGDESGSCSNTKGNNLVLTLDQITIQDESSKTY